jgi:Na+/H+-dicarboxylate symporter
LKKPPPPRPIGSIADKVLRTNIGEPNVNAIVVPLKYYFSNNGSMLLTESLFIHTLGNTLGNQITARVFLQILCLDIL